MNKDAMAQQVAKVIARYHLRQIFEGAALERRANDEWSLHVDEAYEILAALPEIDALRAQLPEGMKHCTIIFKECDKGHGRLTATNWIDHGCRTCEIEKSNALLSEAESEIDRLSGRRVGAEIPLQELRAQVVALKGAGVPTLLWCPRCGQPHIDRGLWATTPHRTHYCRYCCTEWRPFEVATYGCEVDEIRWRITNLETHTPLDRG